jgi:cation diffusion facilitator CzcD-associated flavoprotein CzcO
MESEDTVEHHDVVIAGSGFSGLGMAIALKRDGIDDLVVLERDDDLGGTWRDNTYPGCACDVPSILYSWSDEQHPDWSRFFAPQPEIWDYMRAVAERHDVVRHVRYGEELLDAAWDDGAQRWSLRTGTGSMTADVLVSAVGALSEPSVPALPGLGSFAGTTFHSARWDHDHDLTGRKVAVIGTGASAIQFVPYIQPHVAELHLFQRTPPWILPRPEWVMSERLKRTFRRVPVVQRALRRAIFTLAEARHTAFTHPRVMAALNERMALKHLADQVPDPELRAKLTPDYRMGCKRILGSSSYYPAVSAPNASVVTAGIREVVPEGIVDEAGRLHEVDTIIFGTGFKVTDLPIGHRVRGRDGRTLVDTWRGSMKAYLGTAVAGFPNLFVLLGPNTGLGHNSVLFMIETQTEHIRRVLAFRRRHGLASIEPREEAQDAFVAEVDRAMEGSVWTAGGCQSWYLDETGRNSTLWPQTVRRFERRLARFVPTDHRLELPRTAPGTPPAAPAEAVPA